MRALLFHYFAMYDFPLSLFFDLNFLFKRKNLWFLWSPLKIFHHSFFWNLFMEICPLKICSGDLFLEYLFMEIFPFMKICSWRFFHWRFLQEIFPVLKICLGDISFHEDVFIEICPLKIYSGDFSFMKMCSWRFILWRLKCRRFIPFEDLSFKNLNKRFIPWKFVHGDLSFEKLNRRFIPWRFVLWRFVQEIFHFSFCFGDLSFKKN